MKKLLTLFPGKSLSKFLWLLLVVASQSIINMASAQHFTSGNVVVYRVGTGTGALSSKSTAVFLDEYTTTANQSTPVSTVALPTATSGSNFPCTASGSATSEGGLARSGDGLSITATGYGTAPGLASIASTSSTTVPRVVAVIDHNKNINTATALTNWANANNPRNAITTDGNSIWVIGAGGGAIYTTLGNTGSSDVTISGDYLNTTNTPTVFNNGRRLNYFNGQLYTSSASGGISIATVGSPGTLTNAPNPTTTVNVVQLPGVPSSSGTGNIQPYGFYFADLSSSVSGVDVLYVTDNNGGFVYKYSLVSGTWTAAANKLTITGVSGLCAKQAGTSVTLFASNPTTIFTVTDAGGYNANFSTTTLTTVATAATNTAFRDVAFAPDSAVVPTNLAITTINNNSSPTANEAFQMTVQAQDVNGNVGKVSVNTPVTLSVASGSGTITGSGTILAGSSQVVITAVYKNSGNVAESNVSFGASATGGSLVAGQSGLVNILAAPTTLIFSDFPSTGSVNSALSSFTVLVQTTGGVTDPNYFGTVTLTKASGSGNIAGTLTANASAGVATFSNVQFDAAGTYTVTASASLNGTALTPGASSSVVVTAPSLVFQSFPSVGALNSALNSFTVQATNTDNSVDAGFNGTVTLAKASGTGTVSGTLTATAVSGVATFSNVKMSALGTYTLTATAAGLTSGTSSSVTIQGATTYKWNVASGNWSTASSWTPSRTTPLSSDILVFDGSVIASPSITADFTTNQTVGSVSFTNNVNATITTAHTTTINLNGTGNPGNVFVVTPGCSLSVTTTAAAGLSFSIPTGFTGVVDGVITFDGGSSTNTGAHRLNATDTLSLVFANGSYMIAGTNASGGLFGNSGSANRVDFKDGATYVFKGGANPFQLTAPLSKVLFEQGSVFENAAPFETDAAIPALAGRVYNCDYVVSADYLSTNNFNSGNATFNHNFTIISGVKYKFLPSASSSANYVISGNLTINGTDSIVWGNSEMAGTVELAGGNNVISSSNPVIFQNLTNSGTTTIKSGTILTVNGTLASTGTFIIEDGASLVQPTGGLVSGTGFTVQRNGADNFKYNLWSSPILNGSLSSLRNDIYKYVESARTASSYSTGWVAASGTMTVGEGYIATNGYGISFTGTVNTGNITVPVTLTTIESAATDGWNLLGNPYPCDITVSSFLTANSSVITPAGLYFWSNSSGNYVAANSGNIPSCQGLFVQAIGSGNVSFNNSMRTTGTTAFYRIAEESPVVTLTLTLTNPDTLTDQTQIEFSPSGNNGYSQNEDLYKLKGNNSLEFYSKIDSNAFDFSINVQGPLTSNKVVPLGYDATVPGTYTIGIKDTTGFNGTDILLQDKLTGATYNLSEGNYQFTSGSTTANSRFSVVFSPQSVTGISSYTTSTSNQINIYAYNKIVYVKNSNPTGVVISDVTGRQVYQGNSTEINLSNQITGMYLVSVIDANGVTTQKVIIQ